MSEAKSFADKIKGIPMVFILGLGRSGTTLLQSMLDAHPNVVAPPESKFILLLYPRFHSIKKWTEKDIKAFVEALYIDPLFGRYWGMVNKGKLLQDALNIKDYADYATLCKLVCYHMRENKENVSLISYKVPLFTIFAEKLQLIFPETKFIHLVRNPYDNLYSHIKSYNIGDVSFVNRQWLGYNSYVEGLKQASPSRYFTIQYENMVKDSEASLKSISTFLDIEYSNVMLQQKLGEYKNEKEFKQVHESLMVPVNTSNVGKWKGKLTEEQIASTNAILGSYAKNKYGYENAETQLSYSGFTVWKTRLTYKIWRGLTLFRYKSLNINLLYSAYKRWQKGDKLHIWNYF